MESFKLMPKPLVHIWSDGSCAPNPGPGGWGAVLIAPEHDHRRKELSGAEPGTTNNRMEMLGAIRALEALKLPSRAVMHTDSQYLKNAFTNGWLVSWQKNGWKTSARKDVLNKDLWQRLLELASEHELEWKWVKGHAFDVENNRCDELANAARMAL